MIPDPDSPCLITRDSWTFWQSSATAGRSAAYTCAVKYRKPLVFRTSTVEVRESQLLDVTSAAANGCKANSPNPGCVPRWDIEPGQGDSGETNRENQAVPHSPKRRR